MKFKLKEGKQKQSCYMGGWVGGSLTGDEFFCYKEWWLVDCEYLILWNIWLKWYYMFWGLHAPSKRNFLKEVSIEMPGSLLMLACGECSRLYFLQINRDAPKIALIKSTWYWLTTDDFLRESATGVSITLQAWTTCLLSVKTGGGVGLLFWECDISETCLWNTNSTKAIYDHNWNKREYEDDENINDIRSKSFSNTALNCCCFR